MKMSNLLNLVAEQHENSNQASAEQTIEVEEPSSSYNIEVQQFDEQEPAEEFKIQSSKIDENFLPPIRDENRGIAAMGFKGLISSTANQ